MSTNIASNPSTFTFVNGTPQSVTFQVPPGFVASAGTLALAGNQNINAGIAPPISFTWNTSGEVDTFSGTTTVLAYSGTATLSTGGLSDVNDTAGMNAGGMLNYTSAIPTFQMSVTSFLLELTGYYQPSEFVDIGSEQPLITILVPF